MLNAGKGLSFALVMLTAAGVAAHAGSGELTLERVGLIETGIFDDGAAEISAYDPSSQRLFTVNGATKGIDIADLIDPAQPKSIGRIDIAPYGRAANSVAAHRGLIAVAVEASPATDPGRIAFFDSEGTPITDVAAGALPDMLAFTPDGLTLLVANEGEPSDDYSIDPEGSITLIRLQREDGAVSVVDVETVSFAAFNDAPLPPGLHPGRPVSSLAQNLEPEFIAISPDGETAFVSLQENNALAVLDIAKAEIVRLVGLGYKDHNRAGHGLDASDKDGAAAIRAWPVYGLYQPDALAVFDHGGRTYIASANEGDARDYEGWSEETRVAKLALDPAAFPDAARLQDESALGRLKTTLAAGDIDGDGDHDAIYSYGTRSFSVWSAEGDLVFDSGDAFERILAKRYPNDFNSTDNENASFDGRSDDKGPEPEGIAVGLVGGERYAFIGLERMGGVMIYRLADPAQPEFVDYVTTRDFAGDQASGTAGDLAPEGLSFIAAEESPMGEPLLVVAHEVSGTVAIFAVRPGQ